MKRTASFVIGSRSLKLHNLGNFIHDINAFLQLIYA